MLPLSWQALRSTYDHYPTDYQESYYEVEIYNLRATTPSSMTIDVGGLDAIHVDNGFYYKEPLPGPDTMRWTSNEATLSYAWSQPNPVSITIRAMIFRPEGVPETAVTVWLDDTPIGQFTPQNQWQTISLTGIAQPNKVIVTYASAAPPSTLPTWESTPMTAI